jgi:hypothetical protein
MEAELTGAVAAARAAESLAIGEDFYKEVADLIDDPKTNDDLLENLKDSARAEVQVLLKEHEEVLFPGRFGDDDKDEEPSGTSKEPVLAHLGFANRPCFLF